MKPDKTQIFVICFAVAAMIVAIVFYTLSLSSKASSVAITDYKDRIVTENRMPVNTSDTTKIDTSYTTDHNDNNRYTSPMSIAKDSSAQNNATPVETCGVRIENTFAGTNKIAQCVVDLDKANQILTLKPLEDVKHYFRILKPDENECTIQFINDGVLETEKAIYRRTDLEKDDTALIYTSRTGEITITLIK